MKTITFNKKKYDVPENWDEVTLGMVMRTQGYLDVLPDSEAICLFAGYTGIPIEEIKSSKVGHATKVLKDMKFIYSEYQSKPSNDFVFSGQTYSMPIDIKDIPFEDYISSQTVLYNYRDRPVEGLTRLVAVLCKLEGESIDDINLSERASLFEELPYTYAKDVESFFLLQLKGYELRSRLCLKESQMVELIRNKLEELRLTMKSYVERNGGSWLTKFRIMYLRLYLWYLKRELERYFSIILSKDLEVISTQTSKK